LPNSFFNRNDFTGNVIPVLLVPMDVGVSLITTDLVRSWADITGFWNGLTYRQYVETNPNLAYVWELLRL